MNLIDDELNIKEMYKYQLEDIYSDKYQKYIKYLNTYFQLEHKKDKYSKNYLDGKYILIEKSNPKKIVKITTSDFININQLYIELKEYSETMLNKISILIESKKNINETNRKDFELFKNKYITFKQKINDIENINKDFYTAIEILINEKIDKSNELDIFYQKRNNAYANIKIMIHENIKNNLIKIFKNNNKKIPSDKEINKIAKDNSIPSAEIENWFKWIEATYFYLLSRDVIVKINKTIESKEKEFDINTRYMIIKKPVIEE